MFNFEKKMVSDKDFVALFDCMINVRHSAQYDEFDVFKKNVLKIDGIMNGVARKNYAKVIRKLIVRDHKWEACFTEPNTDVITAAVHAMQKREAFSLTKIGRSFIKTVRASDANNEDLYERFLGIMNSIADSTMPVAMGDRTIIVDGNRTSAAGNGLPHCFMDTDTFASEGRCAIPMWTDGLESKVYGLAVCEY